MPAFYASHLVPEIFQCLLILQTSTSLAIITCITPSTHQVLKDTLDCKFKSNKTVGLTVSVVRSDRVLFVGGYGFVDIEKNTPVTGDTLFFQKSSLSKAFASVFYIITQIKVYVLIYSPWYICTWKKDFYDSLRSDYVTLRDLLSHKTGIPKDNEMRFDTDLTPKNLLAQYAEICRSGCVLSTANDMSQVDTFLSKWRKASRRYQIDFRTGLYRHNYSCIEYDAEKISPTIMSYTKTGQIQHSSAFFSLFKWLEVKIATMIMNMSGILKPPKMENIGQELDRMVVHTGSTWGYRAMLSWYAEADIDIFVAFTGNDPNYTIIT
ncbi:uncharacterized protein [Mytilus edulis]|uniref:uncharacterized protein n=1 Tax=Mytilus edulis TaxID=6550 RepID=UPI0039EEEF98